jgi:hypothetical protein
MEAVRLLAEGGKPLQQVAAEFGVHWFDGGSRDYPAHEPQG